MFLYEHQARNLAFKSSQYNFSITLNFMCNFKRNLQLAFQNANLVIKYT